LIQLAFLNTTFTTRFLILAFLFHTLFLKLYLLELFLFILSLFLFLFLFLLFLLFLLLIFFIIRFSISNLISKKMAAAAPRINPNRTDQNNLREWPMGATEGLIRRRRHYKEEFFVTRQRDQNRIWERISNFIYNNYNVDTTARQCRQKWNSLVYGYENLKNLNNNNPRRYRTFTPSFYDIRFYNEMSSEFWINTSNYLFIWFLI
jgi:hypothetical protein